METITELFKTLPNLIYENELWGDEQVSLTNLEILNRNEFFSQRYYGNIGARTNVQKISIIFFGNDDISMRSFSPIFDYDGDSNIMHEYHPMLVPGRDRKIRVGQENYKKWVSA